MPDIDLILGTTKHFPRPSDNACSVTLSPGSLEVREADGDEIIVTCLIREGTEDGYRFSATEGTTLKLTGQEKRFSFRDRRARIRLELPQGCALTAELAAGTARIEKVSGKLNVQTQGGSMAVERAEDAVTAKAMGGRIDIVSAAKTVTAEAQGGSIRVGAVGGALKVMTSGGSIEAHIGKKPSGSATALGGSIRLFADEAAAFTFDASVEGGRILIGAPFADSSGDANRIKIKIGETPRTTFKANTRGGNIALEAERSLGAGTMGSAGRVGRVNRDTLAGLPQIEGPDTYERSNEAPPVFRVAPGASRFWGIELAADPVLFDSGIRPPNTPPEKFFASWQAGMKEPAAEADYQMDEASWRHIRKAEKIYYRIVTSDRPDAWVHPKSVKRSDRRAGHSVCKDRRVDLA